MEIKVDNLEGGEVILLLEEHLQDMYATSPAESVHALGVAALKAADITFFSSWNGDKLLGCVAIKELDKQQAELKSMRTASDARNLGVASALLNHVLQVSTERGYRTLSLETGSQAFFNPAHRLYEKFGFEYCGPFGSYCEDPHSKFMTRSL